MRLRERVAWGIAASTLLVCATQAGAQEETPRCGEGTTTSSSPKPTYHEDPYPSTTTSFPSIVQLPETQ